jgi:uncharacterized repeat protein (TIGR01451 family)
MKPVPLLKIASALILGLALSGAAAAAMTIGDDGGTNPTTAPPEPGLRLLRSDETGVTLELWTPAVEVEQGMAESGPCDRVTVAGYAASDAAGWPALPLRGSMLGVPPGVELRLTVVEAEDIVLAGAYSVCPVPHPIVDQDPAVTVRYRGMAFRRDEEAYGRDAFYPPSVAEIASTGFVRGQRVAQLRLHPLQYNPVTGQLRRYRRIRVRLDFVGQGAGRALASDDAGVDEGPFEASLRRMLLNAASARAWRVRPARGGPAAPVRDAAELATIPLEQGGGGAAYRVEVDEDGLYRITRGELAAAGVDVGSLDPRTLRLQNRGETVAIQVTGEGDGSFDAGDLILFYGQGVNTRYTDVNVYWLSWGDGDPRRMADRDGAPSGSGAAPDAFSTTVRWEENHNYRSSIPSGEGGDHWFAGYVYATAPASKTYTLALHNLATAPYSATMRGMLYGYSHFRPTPDHHTRVYLNGHLVDDATWDGWREYAFEHDIPGSYLVEGVNEITVELPFDLGPDVINDIVFVNWFEIDYEDTHVAEGDVLPFNETDAGSWAYQISGFTTDTLEVLDVTSPTAPVRILSPTVEPMSSTFTLRFADAISSEHRYLALATGRRLTPLSLGEDAPSDLRSAANGADYVIITHGDFYTEVLPLADRRQFQGLRTAVVDVQDIYDEFNDGIFHPSAIHDSLAYAYEHWAPPAPSYVLLVGDGNYDFKDHMERHEPNYVPPRLAYVDPWIGEVAADNRYVCVSGDDILPDMHLGRLPAKTAAEASAMVNKILIYEEDPPPGDWNEQLLFVADNADDAGDFAALSDAIADGFLPAPYAAEKIYYKVTHGSASQVKAGILGAINEGRLLVNYVGHATPQFWAFEHFLDLSDIPGLTNGGRLPLMVPMTCLDGYYIHPSPAGDDLSCLGEGIVRAPGGGAVASWSATGLGISTGHDFLNKGLFEALFHDDVVEVGPATTAAKLYLYANSGGYRDLLDTYVLLGDPALRLNTLAADVGIDKTVAPVDPVEPGDTITYTLAYTNAGPAAAHHVVITDVLPAALSDPVVNSSDIITAHQGTRFAWDVADLAQGQGGTITITAVISPTFSGTISNTATIATTAADNNPWNDAADPLLTAVLGAELGITKTVDPDAWVNPAQALTYTLTYANNGGGLARGVVITDLVPISVTRGSLGVVSSGATITPTDGAGYVWEVEDLSPGEGGAITITGVLSRGLPTGPLTNTATIATTTGGDQTDDNSSWAGVTVTYDLDGDGTVDVGDVMVVSTLWRVTEDDPDWDGRCDLDADGVITVIDIMKVAGAWGER